jgi:hypothetical protein
MKASVQFAMTENLYSCSSSIQNKAYLNRGFVPGQPFNHLLGDALEEPVSMVRQYIDDNRMIRTLTGNPHDL